MDFVKEDFNWTEQPVIGTALLIIGGEIDSYGDNIDPNIYYEVGKHKASGMTAIFPTEKNFRHEFINNIMKKTNKFN